MFSAKDRKSFVSSETTVETIIEILKKCDPKAKVGVDGDNFFYLHFEEDGSAISFDSSSLDDVYLEQGNYDELPEVQDLDQ